MKFGKELGLSEQEIVLISERINDLLDGLQELEPRIAMIIATGVLADIWGHVGNFKDPTAWDTFVGFLKEYAQWCHEAYACDKPTMN